MSELKAILSPLSNLEDSQRTGTKVRFAAHQEPLRPGEIRLSPMVGFQGNSLTLGFKDEEHGFIPLLSAHYNTCEDWMETLDNPPKLQDDGYYHLTDNELLYMCGYFVAVQATDSNYLQALLPALGQVDKISVVVDTEGTTDIDTCPLYLIYNVTDAEIEQMAKTNDHLTTMPLSDSDH
jgi:hypothetical protein